MERHGTSWQLSWAQSHAVKIWLTSSTTQKSEEKPALLICIQSLVHWFALNMQVVTYIFPFLIILRRKIIPFFFFFYDNIIGIKRRKKEFENKKSSGVFI